MTDSDQSEVIAFLSRPETYGCVATPVERHETHGSIVFLAGDFAYKLKRAVKYPYMDYSTVARRRLMCERELAVNRRTAPRLYLEVRPIVADRAGDVRWGYPGEAEGAADWIVVMQRFAQGDLLEETRKAGGLTPELMRSLAEAIAAFHAVAERRRKFGGAAGMSAVVAENIAILGNMSGHPFPDDEIAELAKRSRSALANLAPLLDQRRNVGFVRACHGDLHLNNICLIDGAPVLFDAIEFADDFANIDVLYDLAFLLMDLSRHGHVDRANAVLNRYLELTWDHGALPALPLFLSCRAAVRAHVTMSRPNSASLERQKEARNLFDAALASLAPTDPQLVAIGGASATGKSTLAYSLAPSLSPAPGAITIRSDLVRKHIFDTSEATRLPDFAYAPEANDRVYDLMAKMATDILHAGYSVVTDAVYGEPSHQREIEAAARAAGRLFTGIWLEAPEVQLLDRLAKRRGDASDATADVVRVQLATISAPETWQRVDASQASADCVPLMQNIVCGGTSHDLAQFDHRAMER